MKTLSNFRPFGWIVILVLLAMLVVGCNIDVPTRSTPTQTLTETFTSSPPPGTTTLSGPEGMLLKLEGEAVNLAPAIKMEVLTDGNPSLENTPFSAASPVYKLSLDSQPYTGGITMTVPFSGVADESPERLFHYAVVVMTETSTPVLVGADLVGDLISFPVVGSGHYQVLAVPALDASAFESVVKQPLFVPSYPQMTPSWCSTTAMTDIAGFHEGAWPAGGLGSVWGESANWYLAGLGGQAFNSGYFFHWVLGAGGYTAPENVKQSFTDGNAEVIIWDWRSYQITNNGWASVPVVGPGEFATTLNFSLNNLYANSLFNFFKDYVENQVWGELGNRRPVAWGSSLAGHSRVITGSDGTNFYFNNPSSGSWNDTKSWETYRQEVIDSLSASEQEVIDTAVFYAPVRPAEDRRAVLWLWQANDDQPGSIVFKRGAEGNPAANWLWDGAFGHQYGYYYNDLAGDLPLDSVLGVQLKSTSVQDVIEYSFSVRSISEGSYDYEVQTRLYQASGNTQVYYGENQVSVDSGGRNNIFPAGEIPIHDLSEGMYYLKFTLMMGGVTEDVKYVYLQLAPPEGNILNHGLLKMSSNCRKGPGTNFEVATPLNEGLEMSLISLNPEMTWGLFDVVVNAVPVRCWVSMDRVEIEVNPNVPFVTVVPPVTAEPPATVVACSDYKTSTECGAHPQCTWVPGAFGPGVCKNK